MAPPARPRLLVALAVLAVLLTPPAASIGVNYGTKGDNLPPPATVASFLAKRTRIDRVKLFDTNPDIVRAFAGTGLELMVTAGNGDIPALATRPGAAAWVAANVAPYYPATNISLVAVGNEIMATAEKDLIMNLVPAMRALRNELVAAGYPDIRVSTPHSLGILSVSEPPSASRFRNGYDRLVFAPMLEFHRKTKSPFIVNTYPYFGYNGDTLDYALARPNPGVLDPGTGITYTSMYEAQLDSVYSAMKSLGYEDVEIAVGETGWPTAAEVGQIGVSPADAAEYNRYLINEASSGSGTPLMPRRAFETYIFALFNENLKPGPVAERNFGLFLPDLTPAYDVGLLKDEVKAAPEPAPAPAVPPTGNKTVAAAPAKAGNSSMAPPPGAQEAANASPADASAPAPSASASSSDAASPAPPASASSSAASPAPLAGGSGDEEPPEDGDAEAPTSSAPTTSASASSEPAAQDKEGEKSSEKAAREESNDTALSPGGTVSEATSALPVYSTLALALSLPFYL